MPYLRPLELFLVEVTLFLLLWLFDDYLAFMISMVFVSICAAVLLFSLVAELIERSKVPRSYFTYMVVSILAPVISGGIYLLITGGEMTWLN